MDAELMRAIDKRIETLFEKVEETNERVNAVHTDVKVIKNTCQQRGENCRQTVIQLDKTIKGNGVDGLLTRVSNLEKTSGRKEKFVYLIIGCLGTAFVSLLVALLVHHLEI